MKICIRQPTGQLVLIATMMCLTTFGVGALAQDNAQVEPRHPATETSESAEVEAQLEAEPAVESEDTANEVDPEDHGHDNVILHFSGDSHLPAGETANAVISIFGSSNAEGDVREAVVSVFGNTRVSGRVDEDAVAVFGSTYIDGTVRSNALAVLGDVELGPNADVGGDVVSVGGKVTRAPGAVVGGSISEVGFGAALHDLKGLHAWVEKCLLYGRPLAFDPALNWAWGMAFGALALYVALALLFPTSVQRCVETLEQQPGQSVLASVLTVLLTPVLIVVLLISVVGIGFVPFLLLGLFCACIFGKAVILGALGRRVTLFTRVGPFGHIAFAVFVGGIILLGLYVVPVLGYIVYQVTTIIGLGVVIYTLLLLLRAKRESVAAQQPAAAAQAAGATVDATYTAASAAGHATASAASAGASSESAAPTGARAASTIELATYPRANFPIRMGALLIDAVLIGIMISFLDPPEGLFLLLLAIYGATMWKLKGTTIGGIVCNLRVVRLDGRELSWDTAIVRALGCFLSLAFAGLGFLWIIFDEDRQSWHDKIAGTVVVRTPKGMPLL